MKKKLLSILVLAATISACAGIMVGEATSQYHAISDQVELGDSKESVLSLLEPSQEKLNDIEKKKSEKYLDEEMLVEIYYFRSGYFGDGITTDDEFTPYVFNNGKLVGIGWEMLGGPKTQAQASSGGSTVILRQQVSNPPAVPQVWTP